MHHCTVYKSILTESVGRLDQLAHGGDAAVHLELSRMEHGTAHLGHIGKARNHGIYVQRIAVLQQETVHFELSDGIDRILAAALAHQPDIISIGITRETACIVQNAAHTLAFFHLVEHRAFHLTPDIDQAVVWANHNDIVVGQADIAFRVPVQDIVVDVYRRHHAALTIHLDVAQGTYVVDAPRSIQGIESR